MMLTTEGEMLPTRSPWLLRWSQRLLIITGTLAIGYVGFTLLDARLYQVSAKRSLESQIRQEKEHHESQPKAVKTGDVLGRVDIPRLGISVAVLQGTSSRTLRLGADISKARRFQGPPGTAESPATATPSFVNSKIFARTTKLNCRRQPGFSTTRSIGSRSSIPMTSTSLSLWPKTPRSPS